MKVIRLKKSDIRALASRITSRSDSSTSSSYRNRFISSVSRWLKENNISHEFEYRFSDKRRFRFDLAIVQYKIAVEYDGIISSKSRHTTISGFSRDQEKTNLAQIQGWIVLRYTVLNQSDVIRDIKEAIRYRESGKDIYR